MFPVQGIPVPCPIQVLRFCSKYLRGFLGQYWRLLSEAAHLDQAFGWDPFGAGRTDERLVFLYLHDIAYFSMIVHRRMLPETRRTPGWVGEGQLVLRAMEEFHEPLTF